MAVQSTKEYAKGSFANDDHRKGADVEPCAAGIKYKKTINENAFFSCFNLAKN